MEHLQRVWHASRERLPFRTPGSAPILGLANAPIVETNSSNLPCLYSTLHFECPLVLSRFCFELLHMTFVIEDGVPTCIVEVKEEIDGRTPEDTAEQLRRMLNHQFQAPPAPMPRQTVS